MYQRNSQFYSQQVPQNAQISSSYLQQQGVPQGYAMQSSVLSQLQQQQQQQAQTPLQQAVRFSSNPDTINTLRRTSKLASTSQVNNLHLPSLPAQTTPWLLNGSSVPGHQQTQQWQQHLPEQQSALRSDHLNFNVSHSGRSKNLTSPLALQQSSMNLYGLQPGLRTQSVSRVQGNGLSHAMQQSQSSRLLSPSPLTQRLGSTSSLSLPAADLVMQRQLLGRSSSIPSSSIMQSSNSNRMLSSPNRSTHDLGVNFHSHSRHQAVPQPMQSATSSKGVSSQSEKRDKIHIRFDQKKPLHQNLTQPSRRVSKNSDDDDYKDEPQVKAKPPLALENSVRIVIDDDIEIVGTKEAEIMFHIRSDCPIHPYERVEQVGLPPTNSNLKCCSKCFCYICDTLAEECPKWKESYSPHCNANSKSSCWKARRNVKQSPLIGQLSKEELNPEISQAGKVALKYIIRVREAYIDYRSGISCDFHAVPCECSCHRTNKFSKDVCAQCKTVHDTKKKFKNSVNYVPVISLPVTKTYHSYEPVRTVVLEIIVEIKKEHSSLPYSALVLYEALLSELCSHRPADFNHVTRMPSNPDLRCQCNTPQIMEEHIEWELIKLFVLNEVKPSFKEKFIKCVKSSVQPLQLKDILKKFFDMRHWDDLLLQDILRGQIVPGKHKNFSFKEEALVIEMRVKKLCAEEKFRETARYLEIVRNSKPTKNTISNGANLTSSMDKWMLECLVKAGMFKESCVMLVDLMKTLSVKDVLAVFTLLSGIGLPPGAKLITSLNPTPSLRYEVVGADRTAFLLIYLIFMESNANAQMDIGCYLWLANWVNREKLEHSQNETGKWMQSSSEFFEWTRKVLTQNIAHYLQQCKPMSPQAILFTCSQIIIQFMSKMMKNMSYIPGVITAYKNNEWALFYMFSQPALLRCGNHHLINWLTGFMKSTCASLTQFSHEAFRFLIKSHSFVDVCLFMQQWVSPVWISQPSSLIIYFLEICSMFAERVLEEVSKANYSKATSWLSEIVLEKLADRNFHSDPNLHRFCELIGRACCYVDVANILLFKKMFHLSKPSVYSNFVTDLFSFYEQKFHKNLLKTEEVVSVLRYSISEGGEINIRSIFAHYIDKHECPEPESTSALIMNEVIDSLRCSHDDHAIKKDDVMMLYARLFSHEALSWLICAKCSAKMPEKWMEVLKCLYDNGMTNKLYTIVEVVLHQFTLWMKELCVQEKADVDRLLRCLNTFISNIVNTLVNHCNFDPEKFQGTIIQTATFVANPQLQQDYVSIIRSIFKDVQSRLEQQTARRNLVEQQRNTPENLTITPKARPSPLHPEPCAPVDLAAPVQRPTPDSEQRTNPASEAKKTAPDGINSITPSSGVPSTSHTPVCVSNPPPVTDQDKDNNQLPLKLTINKSRLSSTEKNSSPPIGSPITCCPQCGDPMSSSFRCSKCQSRKSVDIRCPSCSQVNQDLKGYNCRFCYASLLEVLTVGETKAPEQPPSEKPDTEKKKKKLKRKKTENSAKLVNQTSGSGKTLAKEKDESDTGSKPIEDDENNLESKRPRLKTVIQKQPVEDSFTVKPLNDSTKTPISSNKLSKTTPLPRAKSLHRAVISKISVDDLTPQPPKPHQRAKEAQQKERPHSKIPPPPPPPRQERNIFSHMREPALSESDSDSDSDHQVPPLVLRRKSDVESTSSTPEKKSVPSDSASATKRPVNQGSLMSKKQKTILNRMKQVGRSKTFLKQPKNSPKNSPASTEWEVTKRRKPGPKSKTSYYSVNSNWGLPRNNFEAR